jgi:hydrogenase/urease accessory protein HupE
MYRSILLWIAASLVFSVGVPANAHTIRPAVATAVISDSGVVDLQIRVNAEVILAGIGPEFTDTNESPDAAVYDRLRLLEPEALAQDVKSFSPRLVKPSPLLADGVPVQLQFLRTDVPPVGDIELSRDSLIYLTGQLPEGSQALVWSWPADFGSSVIRFSTTDSETPQSQWLQPGESSALFKLGNEESPPSRLDVALNYGVIGFEHILPKGLDHILFVVGLFLFSIRLKPLLLQVTAFTLAHTITLGLSIYGVISLPANIVEPLIALSIAYVGIENCLSSRLRTSRLVLVFLFGLLHGMGFAGVLTEIGLPRSEFLTALLTFNIGVEFGQLAVITLCLLLVGWCRAKPWYRSGIVIPASLLIAVTGLYWTVERLTG